MNHAYLDPIAAIKEPREDFIRYLLTAYPIKDESLRKKLEDKLRQPGITWQHPYIEGSQPYQAGQSIDDLAKSGVLHPNITRMFPSQRSLYQHQQDAITAIVQHLQNVVVATGTGSGKTECFLVPMLDRLLKEESDLAKPGVRALILYPMNALVNDQVKRLRQILCQQDPKHPLIRFGYYTSRTEKEPRDALDSLRSELNGYDPNELRSFFTETELKQLNLSTRDRLVNEAARKIHSIQSLSRKEIWNEPPHILVTNYSMLEHMLIRPKERKEIFAASSSTFNTLIIDEAHTYDGSTGTEVSMLLKRFKAALNQEGGCIRCIATSASLGDSNADATVLEFAQNLFDEDFTQVIRGQRQDAVIRLGEPYELPDNLKAQLVLEALGIFQIPLPNSPLEDWISELSYIVPMEQLRYAEQQAQGEFHRLLWFALKRHPLIHRLINALSQAPQPWSEIACSSELWNLEMPRSLDDSIAPESIKTTEAALAVLLQLGALAREYPEDLPLLPVRIHLLFRALEGVYGCINPECQELYLNEKYTCECCNSPVLEIGSCVQCGEVYAFTQRDSKTGRLLPLPRTNQALRDKETETYSAIYTLGLNPPHGFVEEEEDELEESTNGDPLMGQFFIQFNDGWIGQPQLEKLSPLADPYKRQFQLAWYRHKDDKGINGCYLPKCAACGSRPSRSQVINRFITYTDAPLEAMIDSLFRILPEQQQCLTSLSQRKLLVFSDGRQDAAFFASNFQRNNTETVYRQMVWQSFQTVKDIDETASVSQVTTKLAEQFLQVSIPHPDRNSQLHHHSYCPKDPIDGAQNERDCRESAEKRAKELLIREFAIPYARRSSLEAYALLACHLQLKIEDQLVQWTAKALEVDSQEAYIFLLGLTDIIRRSGTVSIQGASNYFLETGGKGPFNRPVMIDANGRSKRALFLNKPEENRERYSHDLAFLPRWKKSGEPMQAQNRLGWYFLSIFTTLPDSDWFINLFQTMESESILVTDTTQRGYHLNWELLNITQTKADWYQCDSCQQIVHVPGLSTIQNSKLKLHICRAYRCKGRLRSFSEADIDMNSKQHYQQNLIRQYQPLPLRSQEHTAQLGTEELATRENNFRQGKINLLSCSTTLEMGVDIGELQAVVLRNFPPHVSNYQQRAGRAGRRIDGVSVTLMYGQRRPHDRFYFEQPECLIAGSNQIPRIDSNNLQIQQRHIRAELLSAFLLTQSLGAEQVKIGDFFGPSFEHPTILTEKELPVTSMVVQFRNWLHSEHAQMLCETWIEKLHCDLTTRGLIHTFLEEFDRWIGQQLSDRNDLVDLLMLLMQEINNLGFNLKELRGCLKR